MTRDWEPWASPEYAESRLENWGHPLDPPTEWRHGKYDRLKVLPRMILGRSVLDVGCGLGHTYVLVKDVVEEYLGLDLASMVKICHRYFPEENFAVGDVHDLSPWGLYDTVICTQLLVHLPYLAEPLDQLWRHVKRCLVVSVSVPSKQEAFQQREDGLIGHRWTKQQLADEVNLLSGVGKVETWKGRRIIYIRLTKSENEGSVTATPDMFAPENMTLAKP